MCSALKPNPDVMNMHTHYLVWIDHEQARIFAIGLDDADEQTIVDAGPTHHVHRKIDHLERANSTTERTFLSAIGEALKPALAIMIVGPGNARTELADSLRAKFPQIAARIWVNRASDHPTDPQLVASARAYFKAEASMHGG